MQTVQKTITRNFCGLWVPVMLDPIRKLARKLPFIKDLVAQRDVLLQENVAIRHTIEDLKKRQGFVPPGWKTGEFAVLLWESCLLLLWCHYVALNDPTPEAEAHYRGGFRLFIMHDSWTQMTCFSMVPYRPRSLNTIRSCWIRCSGTRIGAR